MNTRLIPVLIFLALASSQQAASAVEVIHVDASATDATRDGQTWCSAFSDLQQALATTIPGTIYEIRVAEGVYTPAQAGGNRVDSFRLQSGVAILGGFSGCDSANPDQRNPTLFESILSGDLNGDDLTGGNDAENSFHVVSGSDIDATAVLDGFTITAAYANGSNPSDRGGGIFLFPLPASPTIRRCIIRDNHVLAKGAGMYAFGATATVEQCQFLSNTSSDGGAVYNLQGASTYTNCDFRDNIADALGGAIFNLSSEPTFSGCLISGNQAIGGGGMQNANSPARVDGCIFLGNVATGGLQPSGGGMLNQSSAPLITNCLFDNNTAGVAGGGMHNSLSSTASVHNCTFVHNLAANGGGISNGNSSETSIASSILWANDDDSGGETAQLMSFSGSFSISHTCVQDLPTLYIGSGNISLDPLFQLQAGQDGQPGTPDDDLRLTSNSPCIDAGDPASEAVVGNVDLDGNQRVFCVGIDMGAFEFAEPGACSIVEVPTLSTWGLVVLALLFLVAAKLRPHRANQSA